MTTVLVTGATGFVGSHTVQALEAAGARVIAAVRGPARLPAGFGGEVRQGDLRDRAFLVRALDGVKAVCHCAAWTSAWGHAAESRALFLAPTLTLLDMAVSHGVPRVVFPSSTTAGVLERLSSARMRGQPDSVWPHMANVLLIEQRMQALVAHGTTMAALRLGLFVGRHFGIGMLPILLPRLATHLVPWVDSGRTTLPLIAGADVGRALALAALKPDLSGFVHPAVVGPETPTAREVLRFLYETYGYPLPHFGVSFPLAYGFARLAEAASRVLPGDPFITRSIVLLLEETAADNARAERLLGYRPQVHWKDAVRAQIAEMRREGVHALRMARPLPPPFREAYP